MIHVGIHELPARVQTYMGAGGQPPAQVVEHTTVATSFVRAYTRDVGFDDHFVHPDLASVIITAFLLCAVWSDGGSIYHLLRSKKHYRTTERRQS